MEPSIQINNNQHIKPFSVGLYVLVVLLLSWPFQFWFVFMAESRTEKYLYSSITMVMVSAATFLAGKYIFRDGFKGAGWNWGKPKDYVWVVFLAFFIWLVPSLLEMAGGLHQPASGLEVSAFIVSFLMKFSATLLPGFGEEFGWRGYLLPRLARQLGPKKGLLLHALIGWAWHLPTIVGMGLQSTQLGDSGMSNVAGMVLVTIIPTMLHGVIFAYIWTTTKSLAVATVYHAAFDEIRDTLDQSTGFGPFVEIWQMGTIIILGGVLLWKAKWFELLDAETMEKRNELRKNRPFKQKQPFWKKDPTHR